MLEMREIIMCDARVPHAVSSYKGVLSVEQHMRRDNQLEAPREYVEKQGEMERIVSFHPYRDSGRSRHSVKEIAHRVVF